MDADLKKKVVTLAIKGLRVVVSEPTGKVKASHTEACVLCPLLGKRLKLRAPFGLRQHYNINHARILPTFVCQETGCFYTSNFVHDSHAICHGYTFAEYSCGECKFQTSAANSLNLHYKACHSDNAKQLHAVATELKDLIAEYPSYAQGSFVSTQLFKDIVAELKSSTPLPPAEEEEENQEETDRMDDLHSYYMYGTELFDKAEKAIFEKDDEAAKDAIISTISHLAEMLARI